MKYVRNSSRGFTIVELLVVIAVIALLVGLILPALSGVKKKSLKTEENHYLRQIGQAWLMYANSSEGAALPGYLEAEVLAPPDSISRGWDVRYKYPDKTCIHPYIFDYETAMCEFDSAQTNIAGAWTWRLFSYIDYNRQAIHAYRDEEDENFLVRHWQNPEAFPEALEIARSIAYEPAYGYNGYYIGGYWTMSDADATGIRRPRPRYVGHCGIETGIPMSLVRKVSQISRSSEVVTFCSSTRARKGVHDTARVNSVTPGSHLVVPPNMDRPQWRTGETKSGEPLPATAVEVLAKEAHIPIGRHTGAAAVLYADGHTDSQTVAALVDQQKWIDSADSRNYTHHECPE